MRHRGAKPFISCQLSCVIKPVIPSSVLFMYKPLLVWSILPHFVLNYFKEQLISLYGCGCTTHYQWWLYSTRNKFSHNIKLPEIITTSCGHIYISRNLKLIMKERLSEIWIWVDTHT